MEACEEQTISEATTAERNEGIIFIRLLLKLNDVMLGQNTEVSFIRLAWKWGAILVVIHIKGCVTERKGLEVLIVAWRARCISSKVQQHLFRIVAFARPNQRHKEHCR